MMMMMMIAVVFKTLMMCKEPCALHRTPHSENSAPNLGQEKNQTSTGQVRIKTNFLPSQIAEHFYGSHFHSASVTLELLCTRCKEDVVNTF